MINNNIMRAAIDGETLPLEQFQELNAITTKSFQRAFEIQMNCAMMGVESALDQAKLLTNSEGYDGLMAAETDLVSRYSDKAQTLARESTDWFEETNGALLAWFQKSLGWQEKPVTKQRQSKPAAQKRATRRERVEQE